MVRKNVTDLSPGWRVVSSCPQEAFDECVARGSACPESNGTMALRQRGRWGERGRRGALLRRQFGVVFGSRISDEGRSPKIYIKTHGKKTIS